MGASASRERLQRPFPYIEQIRHDTLGHLARQHFVDLFKQKYTDCSHLLFLDADMEYPVDLIPRLVGHDLDAVSGLYFRRDLDPCFPIAFEDDPNFMWPMMPLIDYPEDGLIKIGATGFGCLLVKRRVFDALTPILKGEKEVAIDHMAVWPWDLNVVWKGVQAAKYLNNLYQRGDTKLLNAKKRWRELAALAEEVRLLRGDKVLVGADIRFSYFVRRAGFDLWLDTGLKCRHYVTYPVSEEDFQKDKGRLRDLLPQVAARRQQWLRKMEGEL